MRVNKKLVISITVSLVTVIILLVALFYTAGGTWDVIGRESKGSFREVLDAVSDNVKYDESNATWSLNASNDSTQFIWSESSSNNSTYDVMLSFDSEPFINAGLDINKLPQNYTILEDKLIVAIKYDNEISSYDSESTPIIAFENLVESNRDRIGFHASLGHYNIDAGDGNLFEWAQNMNSNDKDIVFVLNPEPLIDAGVDPEQIDGWTYSQVPVHSGGKEIHVWKLLKPFNLQ